MEEASVEKRPEGLAQKVECRLRHRKQGFSHPETSSQLPQDPFSTDGDKFGCVVQEVVMVVLVWTLWLALKIGAGLASRVHVSNHSGVTRSPAVATNRSGRWRVYHRHERRSYVIHSCSNEDVDIVPTRSHEIAFMYALN
jgi:hypothetical protein